MTNYGFLTFAVGLLESEKLNPLLTTLLMAQQTEIFHNLAVQIFFVINDWLYCIIHYTIIN